MRKLGGMLWALLVGLAGAGQAHADVITIFDLQGTFQSATVPVATFRLGGTVTIDTTTGIIQSQSLFPNPGNTPLSFEQGFSGRALSYYLYALSDIGTAQDLIYFNVLSLVGYTGGNLGSVAHPTAAGSYSGYNAQLVPVDINLIDGTATPQGVAVPEPGSLWLVAGAGVLALGLMRRARQGS